MRRDRGRLRPKILGIRIIALVDLYRWRLGQHKAQELLAGVGIAGGVALFFGALVANASVVGSAGQLVRAVTGAASLQLAARSPEGFPERLATEAGRLASVKIAAPLLRANATIVGPRGRESIQLVGVTASQIALKGPATRELGAGALLLAGGLGLPFAVAQRVGAQPGEPVTLQADGDASPIEVRAVLGSQAIGVIAGSPVAIALLRTAQRLTGLPGRVTQVLIEPRAGAKRQVERELERLAAGRLDVLPAEQELSVLKATAAPTSQSTTLFAAISALVGFLVALNAMLLTVPDRRRFAAARRQEGFGPGQVVLIMVSQAVMLGLAASLVGIVLGDLLSRTLTRQVPSYITLAFPIGTNPVVPVTTVLLAVGCGVCATILASLLPVMDLRRNRATDAVLHETGEAGQSIGARAVLISAIMGVVLIVSVTGLVLLAPGLSIVGGVVLALATFCLIPPMYVLVVRMITPISRHIRGSMLALAMVELDATATRSVALASVAALAVYGMIAIQGARNDLIGGLDAAVVQYLDTANVWVTTDDNFLTIDSFKADGAAAAIARAPGIASVREYQGALLDVGTRRLWVRARPATDSSLIQSSQLLSGNLAHATQLIRLGGWAAISKGFAAERHLRVGDTFILPTPSGQARLGVAAVTTNVGWPPGAITINDADYRRYWDSARPTALEINLKPGVTPTAGKLAVEQALAGHGGLLVETYAERRARYEQSARQGLESLSEISTLLLIAASLAIAAALSAAIWQRRSRLASLKSQGFDTRQLWRSLLLESTILLSVGCLVGTILGVYGHALASRWLELSVGFPAPFMLGVGLLALTLGLIVTIALVVIALPGLAAARVPWGASFQE